MRCAVVDLAGTVINIIMADPDQDSPPQDCALYAITPDIWVDIGWQWADRIPVPSPATSTDPGAV